TWVEVIGGRVSGPASEVRGQERQSSISHLPSPTSGQVSIFNGATGSAVGQYNVRNGGQLVVRGLYHEKSADALRGIYLADSGTLAIDASRFSYLTSPQSPLVAADSFQGLFTLATSMLMPVDSTNTCRFE